MTTLTKACGTLPTMTFLTMTAVSAHGQTPVADYLFGGNLNDHGNHAPALTELVPDSGFYVAVPLEDVVTTGYRFPEGAGLQVSADGLLDNDEYTVAILALLDVVISYRKILDTKALSTDTGLYVRSGELRLYPAITDYQDVIQPGAFHQIVVSRAADGTIAGYVDGEQQFEFDDSTSEYGLISEHNLLTFFRDDNGTSNQENAPGVVLRIRLFDTALDAAQVAELEHNRAGELVFRDALGETP